MTRALVAMLLIAGCADHSAPVKPATPAARAVTPRSKRAAGGL